MNYKPLLFLGNLNTILFPLGIVASTFTKLRVPGLPIGVGELVMVLSFLVSILQLIMGQVLLVSKNFGRMLIFWVITFLNLSVGIFWGDATIRFYGIESYGHDLSAYLFTFLTSSFFWLTNMQGHNQFKRVLKNYLLVIFIYFSLCCIALTQPKFVLIGFDFAYQLFRFSGLSENPNQLACFCVGFPFMLLYAWPLFSTPWLKVVRVILLIEMLLVGVATLSDALVLSWVASLSFLLFRWFIDYQPLLHLNSFTKAFGLLFKNFITPLVIVFAIVVFSFQALNYADDVYNEGSQGSDRVLHWRLGIEGIKMSPLFGFGPGSYSGFTRPFEGEEAHNSFIDFTLSTGLIGLIVLCTMLTLFFKILWTNKFLFAAGISMLIYIMFGFFLRQPFFWFNLLLIVELANASIAQQETKSSSLATHKS